MNQRKRTIARCLYAFCSCVLLLAPEERAHAAPPSSDKTPPVVTITSPAASATLNPGALQIRGTSSDNVAVTRVDVSIEGVFSYTRASQVNRSWANWTFSTTLSAPGTYRINARASDKAGNTGTHSVTVTVPPPVPDTTPPTVSISDPSEGSTVGTAPFPIRGTAFDNSGGAGVAAVEVSVDGSAFSAATPTAANDWSSWSFWASLSSDGAHQVTARARDAANNVSSTSVSFTSTPVAYDVFGIRMVYPTKPGGEAWHFTSPTGDPRFDPKTTMTLNPDGSYKVTEGQVRMNVFTSSGYHPELIQSYNQVFLSNQGYMQSPNDWQNVEITAYVKVNRANPDDFAWYARGGKHNDLNQGCEGTSVKGGLSYDGRSRFAKEQWHSGGYSFSPWATVTGSLFNRWVGFKTIIFNFSENGTTAVRMENWLDDSASGQWVKIYDYVDRGGWGTDGTHCGGAPDQIITWGGPIATFRWDSASDVDIKWMTVREIQP
jgi:hypothetical protein